MARRIRMRRRGGEPRRRRVGENAFSPGPLVALPAQICNFYGIELDGINDSVRWAAPSPWNAMLASGLGYSFHVRVTFNDIVSTQIVFFGGVSTSGGLAASMNGTVNFTPVAQAGEPTVVTPPFVAPGTFDLTFVYDRPTGVGNVWVDGVPSVPTVGTPGLFPVIPAIVSTWGIIPAGSLFPLDGVFQRVAMFARPLSAAEIATLVAVGTPCGADWRNPYGDFLGLAAHYYPCGDDAPAVPVATDVVAAANGTLTSGASIVPLFP